MMLLGLVNILICAGCSNKQLNITCDLQGQKLHTQDTQHTSFFAPLTYTTFRKIHLGQDNLYNIRL